MNDDHAVFDGTWSPLEPVSRDVCLGWLQEHKTDGLLDIGSYISLHAAPPDVEIIDETTEQDFIDSIPLMPPPTAFQGVLYDYQQTGYRWLEAHAALGFGGLLADEMGLGKTAQLLALLLQRVQVTDRPSLVVVPLTLLDNWLRERSKFAPTLDMYVHRGPRRVRRPQALSEVAVVLTTYEAAVSDQGLLEMVEWDLVIADEAQLFKNPDTLRSRAMKSIPRHAAIPVTGTPLENRPLDIWNLVDFAIPGYLGDRFEFESSEVDMPALRHAIRPVMLRREITEVASDLPPRIDIDVALEMFEGERATYTRLLHQCADGQMNPLEMYTKLRMYTTHPRLADEGGSMRPGEASAKLARTGEIATELVGTGNRLLIFAAYREGIEILAKYLTSLGIRAWILDGRTPPGKRQHVVDEFSSSAENGALVLNPSVGGVGLNITAASAVVHYTLDWNPARESQATARAWRRGQSIPVRVFRLFYVESIDEVIVERQAAKRSMADGVVAPTESEGATIRDLVQEAIRRATNSNHQEGFVQ